MLKLMKYEFRKTGFSKLILLVVTLAAELAFLLGVFLEKDRLLATGIMILFLCAVIGIAYIVLESVLALHRDLNTKQSYMLFLTPHSSYEILGAKVLENGISILITGIFFALVAALDALIATLYIGGVKEMMNMVKNFLDVSMNMNISAKDAAFVFFTTLASWMVYIVNADLAVILSATVLAGKKASGLVAFVIFMVLSWLMGLGLDHLPVLHNDDLQFVLYIVAAMAVSAAVYLFSGWIMEKKLSV